MNLCIPAPDVTTKMHGIPLMVVLKVWSTDLHHQYHQYDTELSILPSISAVLCLSHVMLCSMAGHVLQPLTEGEGLKRETKWFPKLGTISCES